MDSKLFSLHGHWCIANATRIFIGVEIPDKDIDPTLPEELLKLGNFASSLCRMAVSYSLLYVVVEGYQQLELSNQDIDELLKNKEYVNHLRRFRNAIFHYQDDPIPKKVKTFLDAEDSEIWITSLYRAFDRFFMKNLPIKEQIDAIKNNVT